MKTNDSYEKIVNSLKRRKKGATVADICAATALPLTTVRELLPKAADEYSGHLQVTQSGEILYHFPHGFTSRYRGFAVSIRKAFKVIFKAAKAASVFLFKVWIVIMLVGYFLLFIAIALASVVLSVAAQSKSSNNRRSVFLGPNLFGLIWRIWFFSEITKPRHGYPNRPVAQNRNKRPMHKAVFSFIFGEDDPNRNWEQQEEKAIIAFLQSNRGVISLPEFMAFTGENSLEAEKSILAFCSKFGGSPEVTEEGTIVYRFDELMLRSDSKNFIELSPPIKRLKIFSVNPKNMNGWFIVINAVNLLFGSYFLYQSFAAGLLITEIQYQAASYLYAFTHLMLHSLTADPASVIRVVLGLVPFVFSILFWVIPVVRKFMEGKENERIKLANFKKLGFSKIWTAPLNVETKNLITAIPECCPKDIANAGDRVIKDLGAISNPEVEIDENGKTKYSFRDLENEKQAIVKFRASINTDQVKLGETVFDSSE